MSDDPTVLLPHRVPESMRATLRERLEDRYPDAVVRETATPSATAEALPEAEVLVTFSLPDERIASAERLEWLQALSAGVDSYDLDALEERGVAVTNAAGVHAEPIGEQVLGYMLAFERELHTAVRQQGRGVWERFRAGELAGKTVGIVGLGAIGTRVAELARAFDMTPIGTKRDPDDAPDAAHEVLPPDGLEEVCRRADYLVLACPLTDETRGLIGRDELRLLGGDGVLINVARGEVVEQDALVRALQQRTVGGAALDVFEEEPLPADSPLWDLTNVILTPHMAGSTPAYADRCADIVARNYGRVRDGEPLCNRVI